MPAGLYFVLRYLSFTFTIHLVYNDTHLYRHNLLRPFNEDRTELDCILPFKRNLIYGCQRPIKKSCSLSWEAYTGTLLNRSLCSYESASDNFEGHSKWLPDKSYKLPPLGKSHFTLYTGTIPDMHETNSASKLDFSSCS